MAQRKFSPRSYLNEKIKAIIEAESAGLGRDSLDVQTVTAKLRPQIEDEFLEPCLMHLLTWEVRNVISSQAPYASRSAGTVPEVSLDGGQGSEREGSSATASGPKPGQGRSWMETHVRLRRILSIPFQLDSQIFTLGSMGHEELRRAAERREASARTQLAHAEMLRAYSTALDEHQVSSVADLPEAVVLAIHDEFDTKARPEAGAA